MTDNKDFKVASKTSIVGIFTNFILATIKLVIGIFTKSISIVADSINNYSDMTSASISFIGFRISNKPADNNHPYGHRRMEYVSALILSIIIISIDLELIFTSIKGFLSPKDLNIDMITIIILTVSIAIKIMLAIYYYIYYKKLNMISLKASAIDSINDSITTSIVLISMIIYKYASFKYTDYICSIIVGIIILISAIGILKNTISPLLGESIDNKLFNNIIYDIKHYDYIYGVHDPEYHIYGRGIIFMSIHVELDGNLNLKAAHEIIDNIENTISNKYNIHLLIHPDPIDNSDNTIIIKNKIIDILKSINDSLFLHDFHIENNNISFECIKPRDKEINENFITDKIQKEFNEYKININFEFGYLNSSEQDILEK